MKQKKSLPVAFVLAFAAGAVVGAGLGDVNAGVSLGAAAFVAFAVAGRGEDQC